MDANNDDSFSWRPSPKDGDAEPTPNCSCAQQSCSTIEGPSSSCDYHISPEKSERNNQKTYSSIDSSSLNLSSYSQNLNNSIGDSNCRQPLSGDTENGDFGDATRPEWVDEILGFVRHGDDSNLSSVIEERINLPVLQSAFAPNYTHLQDAVKVVNLEEQQSVEGAASDAKLHRHQSAIKPPNSNFMWVKRMLSGNKGGSGKITEDNKAIVDNTEEFSLYDNSIVSNATSTYLIQSKHSQSVAVNDENFESNDTGGSTNTRLGDAPSASFNTLCNIKDFSTAEVFDENFDNDLTFTDDGVVSVDETCRNVNYDVVDVETPFDPLPNVSDLPLLGEDLVSPNTETSSCQVEDDDDDFTAMLFGGTVGD